jgi:hypothetical protein
MINSVLQSKNINSFNIKNFQQENIPKLKILKRNLVYIIGLPKNISEEKILLSKKFLGQYGEIKKLIINKENPYSSGHTPKPSFGVYVTYASDFQASLAVLALNKFIYSNYQIKASFGMTRYCNFYLKGKQCLKRECFYVHEEANPQDVFEINKNSPMTKVGEVVEFILSQKLELQNLVLNKELLDDGNLTEFPNLKFCLNKIVEVSKKVQDLFNSNSQIKENQENDFTKKTVKQTEENKILVAKNKKKKNNNFINEFSNIPKKTKLIYKKHLDFSNSNEIDPSPQVNELKKKSSFLSNTTDSNDLENSSEKVEFYLIPQKENKNEKNLFTKINEIHKDSLCGVSKILTSKILSCSINLNKDKSKYNFAEQNNDTEKKSILYWNNIIDILKDEHFSLENKTKILDLNNNQNSSEYELFQQSYYMNF